MLITHEHLDHLDTDRLPALLTANPNAELLVDTGAGRRLTELGLAHRVLSPGDTDKAARSPSTCWAAGTR